MFELLKKNWILILWFLTFHSYSQEKSNEFSFTLRGGWGLQYLGFGVNSELYYNNFGVYYSIGWMDKLTTDGSVVVPATINQSGGFRYYIYDRNVVNNYFLRPAFGAHVGWVNKYWDPRITNLSYNYNLYGITLHSNIQIDFKYLLFDVGLGIVPRFLIFKRKEHPYLSHMYWLPSLGIGFNFANVKRIKKDIYNKRYNENLHAVLVKKMKVKIKRNFKRGVCGNTLIYQQIDSSLFFVARIDPQLNELTYDMRTIYFDTINKGIEVYLVNRKTFNDSICCSFLNKFEEFQKYVVAKAIKGNADIIINQKKLEIDNKEAYRISAEFYDVDFVRLSFDQPREVFRFEEIIIWDLVNSCFCN